ncbi:MAG: phosphate signaling complex protein PhoU [Gammaproteobacteria bacterium]
MSSEHTVRSFDEVMGAVAQDIARMDRLVRDQMRAVTRLLDEPDELLAHRVIDRDRELDKLHLRIEQEVPQIIALRQPMAQDLRQLMSYFGCAVDIERIGDHLKNSARRLIDLWSDGVTVESRRLRDLAHKLEPLLERVLNALDQGNAEEALAAWYEDEEIDRRYDAVIEELQESITGDPEHAADYVQQLFLAKALERIGDHATNIAEGIVYWITGERPTGHTKSR